jgi:O-antigen biosynthesis protein WbqV
MRPDVDVKIEFTGLRPGEKLYEELFDDGEERLDAGVEGVLAALSKAINLELLKRLFEELTAVARQDDRAGVLRLLAHAVPSYHHPDAPARDAAPQEPVREPVRVVWDYATNPRYAAEQP